MKKKAQEPTATEYQVLPVQLTQDEIRQYGKELAQRVVKVIQTEEELSAHSAEVKAQIKTGVADVRRLARIIASGTEQRNVECTIKKLLGENAYRVTRNDTEEVVFERGLTEEEQVALRQQSLPGVEAVTH